MKIGPVVTATLQVEMKNGQLTIDMEILVSVDREIESNSTSEYNFKKVFHLVNAVFVIHVWKVMLLKNTYNEMMNYINTNNLQQ
ncbi:hypothetical protein PL321_10970 [Caloramator sp. mosi_1]|uniref:hypothetical protein n=1 Tax=Caloramator sp. mosi_1 TaxID=3023090 RepID=UPI00236079BE|nr:hypothetical protein [Caloramator sp. mosi_1]WDC83291.1 hypothetical protein PL321_10970 [Caloramator sp. mosi_1]